MDKRLLTACSCLFLMNCVSSVIKVMPEYAAMNVEKSRLGIIVRQENISIMNPNDVVDDLGGGNPSAVFRDFFSAQLLADARTDGKFGNVSLVNDYQAESFRNVNESLTADETVSLGVPVKSAFNSDTLPFVLILDNIAISREKTAAAPMMMGPSGAMKGGGGGSDNLILTGTFVLWDNAAGKIVSFGKLNEKAGVFVAMTKNTWIGMAKNISGKIFIGKPYGKSMSSSAE